MPEKIEYRQVTPEERVRLARMQNTTFSINLDENGIREKVAKNQTLFGAFKDPLVYAAIDGEGHILAGMEAIPLSMWFDGQRVPMWGIGCVVTTPESRRQGHIRNIFAEIFKEIHERGAVFSHLYPFSQDFYRQFGYEQCGAAKKYNLPLAPARRLKNDGRAYEFTTDGGAEIRDELIRVYEDWASRHSLMLSRFPEQWDSVLNLPYFGADRLYYWRDAEGVIKAWVKFRKDGGILNILDIAWADREAMLGILQFMGMYEGQADRIAIKAGPEFTAELYWNNLYEIGIETAWMGMSRILNAKRALELMEKPRESGGFIIKINDGFAAWNNRTYAVAYGGGETAVTESNAAPDIEVNERALLQLVLGVYEFGQTAGRGDVRINSNIETLEKVFRQKKLLITDMI